MLAGSGVRKKQYAFTLVELLVTVTVLAVVLGMAIPSFTEQIARNRSSALGQDLMFALNFARSEAVKRSTFVTLCASDNGLECSDKSDHNWRKGYIVAVDYAAESAAEPDLTDADNKTTILRVWEKKSARAVVDFNINESDKPNSEIVLGEPVSFVRFTKMGTLARMTNPPQEVVLSLKMAEKVDSEEQEEGETEGCVHDSAQQYTIGIAGVPRLVNETCW